MKKLLLCFVFAIIANNAISQENRLFFGAGANLSKFVDNYDNGNYKIGLAIDIKYQRHLSNNLFFGGGVGYYSYGTSFDIQMTDNNGNRVESSKVNFNYNYVSVPIFIGYKIGVKDFEIMPALSFVNHINTGNSVSNSTGTSFVTGKVKTYNAGVRVGSAFAYKGFFVDIAYNRFLDSHSEELRVNGKHTSISAILGYSIKL